MATNVRPRTSHNVDSTSVIAKWARRCGLPLTLLAWAAVVLLILWLAGHVIQTIFLLIIATLLAYALAGIVRLLERVMPRFLAILIVYLLVLSAIVALLYLVISTAIQQFVSLAAYVQQLIQPKGGQPSQLEEILHRFGISQSQLNAVSNQAVSYIEGFAGNLVPLLTGLFSGVLDFVLVAVLSIYLLTSGSQVNQWLRRNMPDQQQGRMKFLLDTLQRVVGGYIRGQVIMCGLIGVLVGAGMYVIGVPFALLLGVLAFVLEFIPVLGTLTSGAICVLLALTKGWLIALIVLAYFIVVHIIEGDVVGPRIVGKTIGLHPLVSITALIAGAELFGIPGALLASPVAGVIQAFLIAIWTEWRETHPKEFKMAQEDASDKAEELAEKLPDDPGSVPKLL
ncbi:MAG TPA: AI-2E family transporter [Ktedonobacteraceae bacterium]|nr:AI-2E family transporter [Ktedonobacteraceae bacterium]